MARSIVKKISISLFNIVIILLVITLQSCVNEADTIENIHGFSNKTTIYEL